MAYCLNLEHGDIIPYEDAFTYFYSGETEKLKQSAISKLRTIATIHKILEQKPILETVLVEEEVEKVEEQAPKNWLEVLYSENKLTEEVKEGLRGQFKGKRITKKDRENLFIILRGVLVRTDFINMDMDSKKTIEEKENSINEFLNTL